MPRTSGLPPDWAPEQPADVARTTNSEHTALIIIGALRDPVVNEL